LGLAACKKNNTNTNSQLSEVEKALIQSNNQLGFKVLGALDSSVATNPVVAPAILGKTFGLLINGADGSTRSALQQSLDISTLSAEDMNQGYKDLDDDLYESDANVTINKGLGLWFKSGLNTKTAFSQVNTLYYNANIGQVNFQDGSGQNTVNQWAASNSNNQIEQFGLTSQNLDALTLATNASSFSALWPFAFNSQLSQAVDFSYSDGTSGRTIMLYEPSLPYGYFSNNEVQLADIPMGNGNYHYCMIMPADSNTVNTKSLLGNITLAKWNNWVASLDTVNRPQLLFPKTELNSPVSLRSALDALYLGNNFNNTASYANLSTDKVFPNDIVQQSYLKIDEGGIDQSKGINTGIIGTNSSYLYFNRPYIFVIWEKTSGAILFLGKVNNPNVH
jgi:serpin B